MKIYEIHCAGIELLRRPFSLMLAADPFPLEQNCDCVEIGTAEGCSELRLWYDDGSRLACFAPAFESLYIDSGRLCADIWLPPETTDGVPPSGIGQIRLFLAREHLLRLQTVWPLDRMADYAALAYCFEE
ncbi:hypothetical protein H9Q10_06475 [Eikenella sp. S3360]|uniref:Uncharacterized protein n=1 Tax=Eikenella glucosivorans TaxID=2766967 RepID=A0ABS0NAK8_9NEIS|nr:hypothetical protein [Eikenella glucosivorans]MBH5329313.1 hypothetical protein [Eikenella glucosivorans]